MGKKAEPAENTPARAAEAKPEAAPVQAGGKNMKKKLFMALAIFGLIGVGAAGGMTITKIMNKSDSGSKTEAATTSEQVVSDAAEGKKEEGAKKSEGHGEGEAKGEGKEGAEAVSLTFDFKKSFTINLLDPSGRQFVQMSIQIQAANAESKGLLEKNEVRLRDATLMLVSSKTLAELQNQGGLDRLKNELRARYEGVLNKPASIKDISYSDLMFVRQ